MAVLMLLVALGFSGIAAGNANYTGKESWGYYKVRTDAYMFWWLYYTDVAENYSDYPLVIWLQGGPGASSTGYGNFMEIGPLDHYLKPRNTTWVKKANLLFLDSPVGSGYSYVTNSSALCTTNAQIADDLLTVLSYLLTNIAEFQKAPLYIFAESYGGKVAVDFGLAVHKAIKAGKLVCNFKGIALGDSWISPFDSVSSWGPYLYSTSLISKTELVNVSNNVDILKKTLQAQNFSDATVLFGKIQDVIGDMTNGVDVYNILKREGLPKNQSLNKFPETNPFNRIFSRNVGRYYDDPLSNLMNGAIRDKLHVIPKNVTWGGQSSDVFIALSKDFMKPVIDSVEMLLNETALDIYIYNGQLDLIVDTIGTLQWVEQVKWAGLKSFLNASRKTITLTDPSYTAGFHTYFKNLHFFWMLKCGHMVPMDAGVSALKMLDIILGSKK